MRFFRLSCSHETRQFSNHAGIKKCSAYELKMKSAGGNKNQWKIQNYRLGCRLVPRSKKKYIKYRAARKARSSGGRRRRRRRIIYRPIMLMPNPIKSAVAAAAFIEEPPACLMARRNLYLPPPLPSLTAYIQPPRYRLEDLIFASDYTCTASSRVLVIWSGVVYRSEVFDDVLTPPLPLSPTKIRRFNLSSSSSSRCYV